jgi:D-alanine-D-alanine ligase
VRVALLHNPRPAAPPGGPADDAFEEYDSPATIAAIAEALRGLGVSVDPVVADRALPRRLEEGRYEVAFNVAEGQGRRCREAVPAAVCDLLGIPFTGSDALTLAVTLDKAVARRIVSPDVPVAPALLVEGEADPVALAALHYPVIVKPNDEGSSKGIGDDAIAPDPGGAARRCRDLRERYRCPVLVEEFLPGAEVTVAVVGNGSEARVLGTMEIAAAPGGDARPFVYSIDVKRDWRRRVRYHVPPRLPSACRASIERLALTAFRLLGCRDVGRLDFRLDAAGRPCFIECNPLPGLDPDNSDIVLLSRDHVPYERLVQGILLDAARRMGLRLP